MKNYQCLNYFNDLIFTINTTLNIGTFVLLQKKQKF